tara:strand:- start:297 stop:995 length:699 start_codon:yes stop_codon:yes gene_type:complete
MLWSKLVDRVLVGFDGTKQNMYRTRAQEYLYEAQEDFVLETKCLEFLLSSDVTKDQYIVQLPDSYLDINRVEFNGELLEYLPLWQNTQFYDSNGNWIMGTPSYYHVQGQELYIIPGAKSAGKMKLWCTGVYESADGSYWESMTDANWEANTTTMRAFTEEPYLQEPYQKYLPDYAKYMIMLDEGDQRNVGFKVQYEQNRERIRKQIQGRKLPVVSRVQDSLDSNTVFKDYII